MNQITKMHDDEFEVSESLVRKLIENQCPQWASLFIKSIDSSGTVHALFRLGSEYVIRLPRIEGAIVNMKKEWKWLPKLAPLLKVPISEPVFKGKPAADYPWCWTVARWHNGDNPSFEQENELEWVAKDLAHFINDLHQIELPNGPASRRGTALNEQNFDEETRKAILELEGEIDTKFVTSLWNYLSNRPAWDRYPVWIHGDLLPGNIILQNQRLQAVIDFSDVGVGDPACDLVISWCLFNSNSQEIFRKSLKDIDEHTWERGRGWALSIALILLPYYKERNPVMAKLARQMLKNVLK